MNTTAAYAQDMSEFLNESELTGPVIRSGRGTIHVSSPNVPMVFLLYCLLEYRRI